MADTPSASLTTPNNVASSLLYFLTGFYAGTNPDTAAWMTDACGTSQVPFCGTTREPE